MLDSISTFDPLSPEFRANPYPVYDMLRSGAPYFYLPNWNMWFLSRHEDCMTLMRDARLGHEILRVMDREELGWAPEPETVDERVMLARMQRRWMLFRDPPDHTRLRGLVHKAFVPRMIERMRERVEVITNALIDKIEAESRMDLIQDYAFPLPATVIAELLGVPAEDQEKFHQWSSDLAGTLDLTGGDPELWDRAARAALEFDAYFRVLADQRRAQPEDDLLSALVQIEDDGETLTEEELLATCIFLLIAGHETTVNLIGNGTLALLRHSQQAELLKANLDDPEFVKNAVEELLRYDSPVQLTTRWVMEDIPYGEVTFKKGEQLAILFAAANRDPERFENPTELDITRENNKHIAFGNGIHFCLGAPLARLEGQIAIRELFRRLPNLHLTDSEPVYRKTYALRGLTALDVAF